MDLSKIPEEASIPAFTVLLYAFYGTIHNFYYYSTYGGWPFLWRLTLIAGAGYLATNLAKSLAEKYEDGAIIVGTPFFYLLFAFIAGEATQILTYGSGTLFRGFMVLAATTVGVGVNNYLRGK